MKRNNILLRDYKSSGKKMAKGGLTKPFSADTTSAVQAGATIADGVLDGIDPTDEYGVRSGLGAGASGAIKGAMAGAALGPLGMAGGAVIGAVTSVIGNKKAEEAKQQVLTSQVNTAIKKRNSAVDMRLLNDPNLLGNPNAEMKYGGTVAGKPAKKFSLRSGMVRSAGQAPDLLPTIAISPGKMNKFALGGPVNDKDPKKKSITTKRGNVITDEDLVKIEKNSQVKWDSKEQYGDWLDKFAAPVPENKPSVAYKFGKRGETMTQDEWDFVRTKRKYPDVYSGGEPDTDNRITGESFSNEVRNDLKEYRTKKMAKGGVIPTSSRTAEVVGPKHAQGGVKIPSKGIEVEGGESMSKDFVFSEQLGIADIHKSIGKAMGNNEKRPDTSLNLNTQKALVRKEGFLKIYQEEVKKQHGMPNEIDNTIKGIKNANKSTNVVMAKGGPIKQLPRLKESKLDIQGDPGSLFPPKDPGAIQLDEVGISAPRLKPKQLGDIVTDKMPSVQMTPMKANVPPVVSLRDGSGFKVGNVVEGAKEVLNTLAPFASNIANSFRRLPEPPKPTMDDNIVPSLINLDADRAEAVRQRRGANKVAGEVLNSGNAVTASRAANLTGQIRATNEINQAETNANAQIKNQAVQTNARINASNNLKQDFYNTQKVERQLKQQSLDSENIADVGNKIQAIERDKKVAALDDDKMLLTIAQDNTGATIRAGDAILKRRLSDEGYKQMKALGEQLSTAAAEDRAALMAQAQVILDTARTNTNTIVADAKAQLSNEKSELNQAKVRRLADSYKQTKK